MFSLSVKNVIFVFWKFKYTVDLICLPNMAFEWAGFDHILVSEDYRNKAQTIVSSQKKSIRGNQTIQVSMYVSKKKNLISQKNAFNFSKLW